MKLPKEWLIKMSISFGSIKKWFVEEGATTTPEFWSKISHFHPSEFDSPDKLGSGFRMDPILIFKLDEIRKALGYPLFVTSGYRTKEHNEYLKNKGYSASPDSAHLSGLAVDLSCTNNVLRFDIVDLALGQGIRRIGVAKTFVHLDIDLTKPKDRLWLY